MFKTQRNDEIDLLGDFDIESFLEDLESHITDTSVESDLIFCNIDEDGIDNIDIDRETFLKTWYGGDGYEKYSAKIEGIEDFNDSTRALCKRVTNLLNIGSVTSIHLFKARKGSGTFNVHRDPVDLALVTLVGSKTIVVMQHEKDMRSSKPFYITIQARESLFIPKSTPHQALNLEESIMLSIGIE